MEKHNIDLKWIKDKYLKEKLSTVAISKLKNVSPSVIESRLTRAGVKLRSCSEAASMRRRKSKYPQLNDIPFLRQKYEVEKLSSSEIAKEIGCAASVVLKTFKKHGIKARTGSQAAKITNSQRPDPHPELKNKEWLYQKYITEKKSLKVIAKEIGTYQDAVSLALRKYRIPIRDLSEARKNVPNPPSQYDKLNDEKWLRHKYLTNGLSTRKITKLAGAKTCNSVRQALIKFDIPVRSVSDGLTVNRKSDGFIFNREVLDGSLLGDGSLTAYNRRSDVSYPHFHKKNIHYDHVEYVAKLIFGSKWKTRMTESVNLKGPGGKPRVIFGLCSLVHKELLPYYREWYPPENNYVKVIPRSVELTPTVLLHWFMDDGCSYRRKGYGRRSKQIVITFCTDCFTKEDQEFLQRQLLEKFDLQSRVRMYRKSVGHYRIHLPQSQADKFYDIIGPCPVPSFEYKWK